MLSVDHDLRPESAVEAQWVADQAKTLGLDAKSCAGEAEKPSSNIQERARQARYSLMAGYAHEKGLDALVTAHHLDDQAEDPADAPGAGAVVSTGLPEFRKGGRWAGLDVLRPLLDIPKAGLIATLKECGAGWLEDPSNDDSRFERVQIRRAMAELEELGVSADALARSASRLRRAREALDTAAGDFLRQSGFHQRRWLRPDPDRCPLPRARRNCPARSRKSVSGYRRQDRSAKSGQARDTRAGGSLRGTRHQEPLAAGRVAPDSHDVVVVRERGRKPLETMVLRPGEHGLWDNRFHVSLDAACRSSVQVRALGERGLWRGSRAPWRARQFARTCRGRPWFPSGAMSALLCVPTIGYYASSDDGRACAAQFVNRPSL